MKTKRILSVLITVVMLIGMLPTAVFAADTTEATWAFGTAETAPSDAAYTYSGTLAEAFTAANGNVDATNTVAYVKLNKDVSMTHTSSATALTLNEGKAMVLDLNSKTYSSSTTSTSGGHVTYGFNTAVNSLLTVKNGKISVSSSNDGYAIGIASEGTLNVLDCTIEASKSNANSGAHSISYSGGVATITNCTITATSAGDRAYGIEIGTTTPALTIADCTVNAIGGDEAYAFYASTYWGKMEFNVAGTITATCANGAFYSKPTTNPVTVTAGTSEGDATDADASAVATYKNKYVKIEPAHIHCICGETHKAVGDHTVVDEKNFTAVSTYADLVAAAATGGNYYLANDIEITNEIEARPQEPFNLCLNGNTLFAADDMTGNIFDIRNNSLTLTDCVGGGKLTGTQTSAVYVWNTFNMYGGAITENNGTGVYLTAEDAVFNMYGGEITNNKAYYGAGIYHHDGTIRISGGTIAGNVAQTKGGAIYTRRSGIEICGNPVIAENFVNSGADGEANQINNIDAYSIEIVGPMTDGASIGMTKVSEEFGYFAIDTYDSSADYCKYFFSDKGYPVYKEDDTYYFGYRITKQPSDTDYSVEVNSTNGANYQWCEIIKEEPVPVDDEYLEDNDGYVIGDYGENGWSALVNSDVSMYFGIEMNANDELTAKFASAPQGEVILVNANTNSFVPVVSGGENTYTFITVDEGPYLLAVFAEDVPTVKATLTKNTLKEVDGQTAATLDTGNLPTGNYACQITWDYLNTPDDTSDDYILQSVVVEYIVPQYTVSFDANGGSAIESKTCEYNQTITAPDAPTKEGFEFIAWYADDALTTKWNFETPVTENKTLYAKWVQGTVSDHEDHVNEVEVEGLNDIAKAEETDIKLVVQTEPITEDDTEQTAIKGITDAPNNFNFYDITLEKSTGGYVTDASSAIEIKLPYDFSRKTNIKVYRYHNDSPEELEQLEARATAPYADGKCFIDAANNCIYIYSLKFSTYAVAYDPVRSSSGGGVTLYTVKFDTDGGNEIASKTVTRNSKIAEPTAPEKEGYTFMGWFTDESLTVAYDFDSKVIKSITLYAKWEKVDEQESEDLDIHNCPSKAFDDLDVNAWYHEDADYVIENGIFKGIGETTFAPNDKLTRAMLVTVLYRMENEPATNRSIPFSDVDMGAYYANAISWAKQNGIVNGVTENEFAPNDYITREQIATIMMRYAVYKGMDAITLEENLHFADADEISEYAVSSMNWAVGKGLINGKSESTLAPKDNATRIEVAAILHRFVGSNK